MKKKWLIISSIIIVIVIGIITISVVFIKNFNEDREKTLKTMGEIKEKYKEFSPLVEAFSEERTKLYNAKEELFFLETVEENKDAIVNLMVGYNDLVMSVHNSSEFLQKNCMRKYSNASTNNTCTLFKQGYEAVMNYYMTDVAMYNEFVSEYNMWLTENGVELEPLSEQQFSLYDSYIDYDQDGSYLGGK